MSQSHFAFYYAASRGISGKTKNQDEHVSEIEADDSELENLRYDDLFNIENWYSVCEGFTMKTRFLSLDALEIEAIVNCYRRDILHEHDVDPSSNVLASLARRIDDLLSTFPSHAAFIRLSARSPKDAGFESPAMADLLETSSLNSALTTTMPTGNRIRVRLLLVEFTARLTDGAAAYPCWRAATVCIRTSLATRGCVIACSAAAPPVLLMAREWVDALG